MRPTPILLAAVLIGSTPAAGLADTPLDRAAALELLRAGSRWAEIEGKLQPDGTFVAKDVEIIAAEDTAHMQEIEITGVISALDPSRRSLKLLGYTILWNDQTKITDPQKRRIPSSELHNDKDATAAGKLQPDGSFVARKLHLREVVLRGGKPKQKQELIGPVEVIDAARGTLRVLKTVVHLKPDCEFVALPVQVESPQAAR
jgi:hypothetical protein